MFLNPHQCQLCASHEGWTTGCTEGNAGARSTEVSAFVNVCAFFHLPDIPQIGQQTQDRSKGPQLQIYISRAP